jgi:hypothetical protein
MGRFIKICWPIIKCDFSRLCHEYWEGSVNLHSISTSDAFITLVSNIYFMEGANDGNALAPNSLRIGREIESYNIIREGIYW